MPYPFSQQAEVREFSCFCGGYIDDHPCVPGNIGVREDNIVQAHLKNTDPVEWEEGVCLFVKGVYLKF